MRTDRKRGITTILLVLAAIAVAVLLALLEPGAPENAKTELRSGSPKYKHKVRGIKYISQPEKPARRDER